MPDIQQLTKNGQLSQFYKDEVEIDVNNKSQLPWKQRERFAFEDDGDHENSPLRSRVREA